jgi:(5-formylfuran-3-yl)methyl phosphate synthase
MLLACGKKSIEIRRWRSNYRGKVLIHAAKMPDPRPQAWARVPVELLPLARLTGGFVGEGEVVDCRRYDSVDSFALDQASHLNEPEWFQGPVIYGYVFEQTTSIPFRAYPGWVRFFPVREDLPRQKRTGCPGRPLFEIDWTHPLTPNEDGMARLLVSVRSVEEAKAALAAGVDLVDVKEPARGSLGRPSHETVRAIVDLRNTSQNARYRHLPVSAALGEVAEDSTPFGPSGLDYAKWGLAGMGRSPRWRERLQGKAKEIHERALGCRPVAVAYADWRKASAPPPAEVAAFACDYQWGAFLVDTWEKDGSTLLDHLGLHEVRDLCRNCIRSGVPVALAGSLGEEQIRKLQCVGATWFAVRGAVCFDGARSGEIDSIRLRRMVQFLKMAAFWKYALSRLLCLLGFGHFHALCEPRSGVTTNTLGWHES